jgi:hypothetical protein
MTTAMSQLLHDEIYVDHFVMPDLIPEEHGIFDRNPEHIDIT